MAASKDEGGCPELSPLEIMALDEYSTEFINGIFVPPLRSIGEYLVTKLEQDPALKSLSAKPFLQWSSRDLGSVISIENGVLKMLDVVAPKVLTDELADVAFKKFGINAIPHWLQREDHWLSHIQEFGTPRAGEIGEHLFSEAFWLKAIELAPNGHVSAGHIPCEAKTEAILENCSTSPEARWSSSTSMMTC